MQKMNIYPSIYKIPVRVYNNVRLLDKEDIIMKEQTIKVEGMVCTGCENRVKNALKTIKGVDSVTADYKKGTVKLKADECVEKAKIKEKIEDLGFTVKED